MKLILFAILFFTYPLTSNASDNWFYIGKTSESKYYINMPSITETSDYRGKFVKSWIKEEIYNDLTKDGLSLGDYVLYLYQSDCKDNKLGLKSSVAYKGDKPFGNPVNNSYVEMKDVIPESIGQSILGYSCTGNEIRKNTN